MKRNFNSKRAAALTQCLYRAVKASAIFTFAFTFSPYFLSAAECSVTVGAPACSAQTDPGSTSAAYLPSPYVANPVDVVSGNKYQHSDDYLGFGSRLQFSRHYNSADSEERTVLGAGWRHSYDVTLKRASPSRLLLKQSDGRILEFLADEQSNTIYRARHSADGFIELADLNRWSLSDGRVLSFKGSFLVEVAYPDKYKLKLKYKNNRLDSVTDHFDRSIKLEYYSGEQTLGSYDTTHDGMSAGDLHFIELPDGSRINYQYDNLQNLTAVSYPEGTQSIYEYADPDFTHHLTGANEALESTQKYWKYDHYGRAIQHTNETAEFVVDIEFAPTSDQQTQQLTRVKTSDGWKADYGWQHSDEINLPIVTAYKEQACPTCKPTQKRFTEKSIVDWETLSQEDTKPVVQKKSAQGMPEPVQVDESIEFVASEGSLGGMVTMRSAVGGGADAGDSAEEFEITVDRVGKVRDVSDGVDSLSEIKRGLLSLTLTNPGLPQSPVNIPLAGCNDKACSNKVAQLLNVSHSAGQSFSIPTINSPANQAVNNRFCASPTFRNCDQLKHDYKMAQLSECVYADTACGNGYMEVPHTKFGLSKLDFEDSGFKATLYEGPSGEMVLAFRGSRQEGIDWDNNIAQGNGRHSNYYVKARNLAWKLQGKGVDFHMTGHSLGGGLASAAALDNELNATIFNAASVHPNTVPQYWDRVKDAEKHVITYTVEDDILSDLQDITSPKFVDSKNIDGRVRDTLAAVGKRIILENPSKKWIKQYRDSLPVGKGIKDFGLKREGILLHSMNAVLETLKNKVLAQCKTLI